MDTDYPTGEETYESTTEYLGPVATQCEETVYRAIRKKWRKWVDPDENIIWVHDLPDAGLDAKDIKEAFVNRRHPDDAQDWSEFIAQLCQAVPDEYADALEEFASDDEKWNVRIARRSLTAAWNDLKAAYEAEDVTKREARQRVVDQLRQEFRFITLAETNELYYYDREAGIYCPDGKRVVRERLEDRLREYATRSEVTEILHKLRAGRSRPADEFQGPNEMICVENGVIDISDPATPTLRAHSPDDEYRTQLPVEFDPDADCPTWENCLDQWVVDDEERRTLQEFIGYCLHHWGLPYQKALLLVGPTGSGKSTCLNVVNQLLGHENVANQSLQALANQRFAMAELYGKVANIYNDLDAASVRNPGVVKMLTAGDPFMAEQKNKDPFRFRPRQKLLFSANQVPDVDHDDDAFYRRWLIVEFPESIPTDERNPTLEADLRVELPGILNWAFDGYARLMEEGQFTVDRDIDATRSFWRSYGTSIEQFCEARVEFVTEAESPESDVYEAYREFCDDRGLPTRPKGTVTKELKRTANVEQTRPTIDGERVRCYSGLRLTGEDDVDIDIKSTERSLSESLGSW